MQEWRGKPAPREDFQNQADFLRDCLNTNIEAFRKRRLHNRSVSFAIKLITAIIGALITLAIGIKPYVHFNNSETVLSCTALLLSATIPVISTWAAFF